MNTIPGGTSDRELLEWAARAYADPSIRNEHGQFLRVLGYNGDIGCDVLTEWNPLTNGNDALRLAVKLKIPLQFPDWKNIARTWGPEGIDCEFDEPALDHDGDLFAATCRAFTRAAAEIGKAMK